MKTIKIIVVALVVLGGLIYFGIWYTFRTTSQDISHLKPFSEIIGKELMTVQPCLIAINNENWVKENSRILVMKRNKLSGHATQLEELPLGSILKIKEARRYSNGVTGFKSTYLLGTVFLEESQKEVPFEFAWGSKNYGTDLPGDYFSYSLAPWQKSPLEVMYNYDDKIEVLFESFNADTD